MDVMRQASRLQTLRRKHTLKRLVRALPRQDLVQDTELGVVDLGARTRADALVALGELGDDRAMEAVMHRLEDPVPSVREEAVRTIRALDARRARAALVRGLLSWPDPPFGEARLEALRTLEELDDPDVPKQVIAEVASSNGAAVLDSITRNAVVSLASDSAQGGLPADLVGRLIDMLRDVHGNRRNVEILLAWLGAYSVDDLITGLDDPALRESAATVLGALREARAVPSLVTCLDDDRPEVRLAAAAALAEIRDVRSVEGLIRAVSDPDYEVRRQAQRALDALGTVGVVAGVAAVLTIMRERPGDELPNPGIGPTAAARGVAARPFDTRRTFPARLFLRRHLPSADP
jgi:HEAT repeat protein